MANQDGGSVVQSVERALSILSCFSDAEPQLRVADMARRLGLAQVDELAQMAVVPLHRGLPDAHR